MKQRLLYSIIALLVLSNIPSTKASEDFAVILKPEWQDLESNPEKAKIFGGKWILAGSIVFKKRAKETVHLNRLYLQWQGACIDKLIGSLYRVEPDKKFIPIQDNLVCDGIWNKAQQTLMLNFDKKETIGFNNTFYLVLTVPNTLESILKKGSFSLLTSSLPEEFKICAVAHPLTLSFDVLGAQITKLD
ncbi:MAG: hypothetical protein NTX86_04980 [Candidatus Dependentiae bacterium]|nr:hypothetical protein [Candidatus Dependentiae bacterium]